MWTEDPGGSSWLLGSGKWLREGSEEFQTDRLMMVFYHIQRSCKRHCQPVLGGAHASSNLHILICMTICVFESISHLGQENMSTCSEGTLVLLRDEKVWCHHDLA